MNTQIEDFKRELAGVLRKYNASIVIREFLRHVSYPTTVFVVDGKEYWIIDKGGYAADEVTSAAVEYLVPKNNNN